MQQSRRFRNTLVDGLRCSMTSLHVHTKFGKLIRADRKSTRLNSSHTVISYAVFCLKKKNIKISRISAGNTMQMGSGGEESVLPMLRALATGSNVAMSNVYCPHRPAVGKSWPRCMKD